MNIQALETLRDALLNPNVLPDFDFDMWHCNNCVIGFKQSLYSLPLSVTEMLKNDGDQYPDGHDRWLFVTSAHWEHTDNTRQGAARRIDYLIKNGMPPVDWREQMAGTKPITY